MLNAMSLAKVFHSLEYLHKKRGFVLFVSYMCCPSLAAHNLSFDKPYVMPPCGDTWKLDT